MKRAQADPDRIQFNLPAEQVRVLDVLGRKLALRSRADLMQEALSTFVWFAQQRLRGRVIVSIAPEEVDKLAHAVELASPSTAWASDDLYEYLVARPDSWRRQLWLRGRHMTVGQLVAWMTANNLSPVEAAEDFDLPLTQVEEALAYYDMHRDLVDNELREEKTYLQRKGYAVEPAAVS